MKTKEIWSNRYGKPSTKTEGIQKFLESHVKNYKRSGLNNYLKGFAEYMGRPNKSDSPKYVSENFTKWIEFLKAKKLINQ